MEIEKKCRNCEHCVWLNRWRCDLTCWEFDLWTGSCCEFEPKSDETRD